MCERETEALRELTMRLQDVQQRHARKVREKNEKERAAMQQMGGSVEAEDDGTLGGAADARWRRTASTRRDIEVCASLGSRSVGSPCTHPTPLRTKRGMQLREGELRALGQNIAQLAALMRDVSRMVTVQGSLLDRVDYNIEHAEQNVADGVRELEKVCPRRRAAPHRTRRRRSTRDDAATRRG